MKTIIILLLVILVGCGKKESSKKEIKQSPPKELLSSIKTPGVYIVEKNVLSTYATPGVYITELTSNSSSVETKECKLTIAEQEMDLSLKFLEIEEKLKVVITSETIEDDQPLIDFLKNLISLPNEEVENLIAEIVINEDLSEGKLLVKILEEEIEIGGITCQ